MREHAHARTRSGSQGKIYLTIGWLTEITIMIGVIVAGI